MKKVLVSRRVCAQGCLAAEWRCQGKTQTSDDTKPFFCLWDVATAVVHFISSAREEHLSFLLNVTLCPDLIIWKLIIKPFCLSLGRHELHSPLLQSNVFLPHMVRGSSSGSSGSCMCGKHWRGDIRQLTDISAVDDATWMLLTLFSTFTL